MPWRPLEDDAPKAKGLASKPMQKAKFLVDENLGSWFAEYLRLRGWNATFALDEGLGHRDDKELFGRAWSEDRILLSHDRDYLDDRKFPPNRNPGVVIVSANLVPYTHEATYDILPESDTGAYFAGGALIGSTLAPAARRVIVPSAPYTASTRVDR